MLTISHKGCSWSARVVKSARLSTGYNVWLFERTPKKPAIGFSPYVVAVKSPIDTTSEWFVFDKVKSAVQLYLDMLCCYA